MPFSTYSFEAREPTRLTSSMTTMPPGTIQSIEHTLRAVDKAADDERHRLERLEKTLSDYQSGQTAPFEHDARLQELLARPAQLNAALDLDKGDTQAVEPTAAPQLEAAAVPSRQRANCAPDGARGTNLRVAASLRASALSSCWVILANQLF
jgi:hypothetical protein